MQVLLDKLENEQKDLLIEKQRIEAELSKISSRKADKLAAIYRRRMHRSEAIAATNEVQSEFNNERSKLIQDKAAVEERLHDIKRQRSSSYHRSQVRSQVRERVLEREDVKALLRIESLLERILEKMP